MKIMKLLAYVSLIFLPMWAVAEFSDPVKISKLNFDGNKNAVYVATSNPNGWGIRGCPDVRFLELRLSASESGKTMYNTVLIAKLTESLVVFKGTCVSPKQFQTNYIIVQ